MSAADQQPDVPKPSVRWYRLTPGRVLAALLTVEGLLSVADWFRWLPQDWPIFIGIVGIAVVILWMLLCFIISLPFREPFQFSIRSLLVMMLVVALPCSWLATWMHRHQQHRRTVERIEDVVFLLADRYPDGVPQQHWDSAVSWTWNAIGNCLAVPEFLVDGKGSERQFARFADELEQRAQGRVGLETIDWSWNEIERLSKNGKSYSEHWRPVRGGQMKEPFDPADKLTSPFVSTADSRVFHKRGCPLVSRIRWRQQIGYNTREAAASDGKSPCTQCNP